MKISSRKPAASKKKRLSRAKPKAPELSPEEVDWLERKAVEHKKSEQAWLQMTAPTSGDEEDRWGGVEEQLLAKSRQREPALRRWKYFAK